MTRELDRAYLTRPTAAPVLDTGPTPARPSSTRPLSVLIVTYKSHDLVEQCLALVAEHLPGLAVYVYENTGDGYPGREELAARHPEVTWVLGPVNLGFAAAFNALAALPEPNSDLLLLNPDARLLGPLTRTRALIRRPGVAAVSPMTLDDAGPGSNPWDVATRRRSLPRALVAAAGYSDALRGNTLSHLYRRQPAESDCIDGYLGGACLAINRDAWNSVGGFDEEFFLFGEETDWQDRARRAGWRIALADEIGVEHGAPAAPDSRTRAPEATHGPAVAPAERGRNYDLLRTNIALLLEHQGSVHQADAFLAGTTLLDRLQRSKRAVLHRNVAARRRDLPQIVITTNRLVYGGAERQKALLSAELDRRGYPVTLVCLQRFGPLIKDIPHTVRVLRQPWWAPVADIPRGPAVVISGDTNTETGFATLWRATGRARRWLVAAHIPPHEYGPIYSRALAATMRQADGFIALADRHWDTVATHHRLDMRHFVAPNGTASRRTLESADPPDHARPVGNPPHLVMLTRLVEHKNPQLLLRALADLADLPWTLSIFGDGPDRESLEAQTPAVVRDRVHWRGWSAGPGPALADADLLCVPSRSEAFPMVILEAMERGVAVAASGVCAVPEMLDNGRAGFVVDPPMESAWRDTLARILSDPASLPEAGRRGYDHMAGHYTVEAMADAYVAAFDTVLGA